MVRKSAPTFGFFFGWAGRGGGEYVLCLKIHPEALRREVVD